MKKIILASLLVTTVSQIAFAQASRGYLYLNSKNQLFFDGLNDYAQPGIYFSVDYALNVKMISQKQLDIMKQCQLKKSTHAILVNEGASSKIVTPIGAEISVSKFDVECVSAPGFLTVWRKVQGIK